VFVSSDNPPDPTTAGISPVADSGASTGRARPPGCLGRIPSATPTTKPPAAQIRRLVSRDRNVARLSENYRGPTTSCTSMTRSQFCAGSFRFRKLRFGRLPRSCEVAPKRRCHFRTTVRNCPTASRRSTRRLRAGENTNAIVLVLRTRRSQLAGEASPAPRRGGLLHSGVNAVAQVVYARDSLTPIRVTLACWPLRTNWGRELACPDVIALTMEQRGPVSVISPHNNGGPSWAPVRGSDRRCALELCQPKRASGTAGRGPSAPTASRARGSCRLRQRRGRSVAVRR
jgi:hypothetical protein